MKSKARRPDDAAELRRRAEESAQGKADSPSMCVENLPPEHILQAFHELEVHQIELQMQNEELHKAQADLDVELTRYLDFYNLAPVGYLTINEKGLVLEANLTAATMLGVLRSKLLQRSIIQFILKEDRDIYYLHSKQLFKTDEPQTDELRMVKPDGTAFWTRLRTIAVQNVNGGRTCRVVLTDITARKRGEEALRESELKFRTVADFTNDWEYWVDKEGRFLWVSPACERLTGYRPEDFLADPALIHSLVHPDDRERFLAHFNAINQSGLSHCDMDFQMQDRGGHQFWVQHICRPVFAPDGTFLGRRGCNRDITKRKQLEEELQRLAATDSLTGISNRRYFLQRAQEELNRSKRYGLPLALLMIDIDTFKNINDTYGHAVGDEVLKAVVAACLESLRNVDTFGRLGGEEFAALLPQTDLAGALVIAERMRRAVEESAVPGSNGPIRVTVSLGLAALRADESLDALMLRADTALYRAKAQGRNRVCACEAPA